MPVDKRHLCTIFLKICILISLSFHGSCNTLHNSLDNDRLNCGGDYISGKDYFTVLDPDGRRLKKSEIEILSLEGSNTVYDDLSSKGCVNKPISGRYLVRSKNNDWAQIIDSSVIAKLQTLTLVDHGRETISISCDGKNARTVSQFFALREILVETIDPKLKDGFIIETGIRKSNKFLGQKISTSLKAVNDGFQPFKGIIEESEFTLEVKIKNLVKNRYLESRECLFRLDHTPPDVNFSVNFETNFNTTNIKRVDNIILADSGATLGFTSNASDVTDVEFCATKLDDNFDAFTEPQKQELWEKNAVDLSCDGITLEKTAPHLPIFGDRKSGIWSIRYKAKDRLGNTSLTRSAVVLLYHRQTIDITKRIALADTSLAFKQNRLLDVIDKTLEAYNMWMSLKTKFERDQAENHILAALIKSNDIELIPLKLPSEGSAYTTESVITPDGKYVITSSNRGTLRFWDGTSASLRNEIGLNDKNSIHYFNMETFPDSKKLLTMQEDGPMKIWDIPTATVVSQLTPKTNSDRSSSLSPDGRILALYGYSGELTLWDVQKNSLLAETKIPFSVRSINFSPDSSSIVIAPSEQNEFQIWDINSLLSIKKFVGHELPPTTVVFTLDGKKLLSGSTTGEVKIWDAETTQEFSTFVAPPPDDSPKDLEGKQHNAVTSIQSSIDGKSFLACYSSGHFSKVDITNPANPKIIDVKSKTGNFYKMHASKDLSRIVVSSADSGYSPTLFIAPKISPPLELGSDVLGGASTASFKENTDLIYIVNSDRSRRIWNYKTGALIKSIEPNSEAIFYSSFISKDLKQVIGLTDAGYIEILNFEDNISKRINFFENFKPFKGIALIEDQKHIVAYTVDKLFVFDLSDGKMVNEASTQSTEIDFIVSSPKGDKFFTEDLGNNSLKIWDASNLKIIGSLIGNISSNFGPAVNHVGTRLVDGTPEGNLLLWDLEKATLLSTLRMEKSAGEFETHSGTNGKFSFSPNGRLVLSSGSGSLNFWDVESEVQLLSRTWPHLQTMSFNAAGDKLFLQRNFGGNEILELNPKKLNDLLCSRVRGVGDRALCE